MPNLKKYVSIAWIWLCIQTSITKYTSEWLFWKLGSNYNPQGSGRLHGNIIIKMTTTNIISACFSNDQGFKGKGPELTEDNKIYI